MSARRAVSIPRIAAALFVAAAFAAGCSGSSTPSAPIIGKNSPTSFPTGHPSSPPTAPPSVTPMPTMTPTAPPNTGGTQAACILTIGTTTYAFVPGINTTTNMNELAEVTIATGSTITARGRRFVPPTLNLRGAGFARGARRLDTGPNGSPELLLNPAPNECSADQAHGDLYLISYTSPVVNVVHVDPTTAAMSLAATYTSDASSSIGFSGGDCNICGIAFDPNQNGFIIATATGYELYAGFRASNPGTKLNEIAAVPPAENFGFDATTDQIWSPSYLSPPLTAQLINVVGGAVYNQSPLPTTYSEPDQGAVDASTQLAVSDEEFSRTLYLVPLNQATLNSPSAGEFSDAGATTINLTTTIGSGCCPDSYIAINGTSHLMLTASEFGTAIGVVQLPTSVTASGAPALGDYDESNIPGGALTLPGDPHAASTFNLGSESYGLLFDSTNSVVFVIDLQKLLATPRMSAGSHDIPASYDLIGNSVLFEIKI